MPIPVYERLIELARTTLGMVRIPVIVNTRIASS